MKPAISVGVVEFTIVACYVIIFTILWRGAAAALGETQAGRAMGAAYS